MAELLYRTYQEFEKSYESLPYTFIRLNDNIIKISKQFDRIKSLIDKPHQSLETYEKMIQLSQKLFQQCQALLRLTQLTKQLAKNFILQYKEYYDEANRVIRSRLTTYGCCELEKTSSHVDQCSEKYKRVETFLESLTEKKEIMREAKDFIKKCKQKISGQLTTAENLDEVSRALDEKIKQFKSLQEDIIRNSTEMAQAQDELSNAIKNPQISHYIDLSAAREILLSNSKILARQYEHAQLILEDIKRSGKSFIASYEEHQETRSIPILTEYGKARSDAQPFDQQEWTDIYVKVSAFLTDLERKMALIKEATQIQSSIQRKLEKDFHTQSQGKTKEASCDEKILHTRSSATFKRY